MEEQMILVKLPMDFLPFMEETRKENNTYFIHPLMIENVELTMIENG